MNLSEPYTPIPVTELDIVFPANVARLMPALEAVPPEFFEHDNEWNRIASHWFGRGLADGVTFDMVDGVEGEVAFDHLRCILSSFEPEHNYKIAAVAYLLSTWCTQVAGWEPE